MKLDNVSQELYCAINIVREKCLRNDQVFIRGISITYLFKSFAQSLFFLSSTHSALACDADEDRLSDLTDSLFVFLLRGFASTFMLDLILLLFNISATNRIIRSKVRVTRKFQQVLKNVSSAKLFGLIYATKLLCNCSYNTRKSDWCTFLNFPDSDSIHQSDSQQFTTVAKQLPWTQPSSPTSWTARSA